VEGEWADVATARHKAMRRLRRARRWFLNHLRKTRRGLAICRQFKGKSEGRSLLCIRLSPELVLVVELARGLEKVVDLAHSAHHCRVGSITRSHSSRLLECGFHERVIARRQGQTLFFVLERSGDGLV
jgi:hypothetical protein